MRRILIILLCGLFAVNTALAHEAFTISDIRVEGLERISEGTVFNYLPVDTGELLTNAKSRQALRSLFRTGFFSDIEFERENDILVIKVVERPAISSISLSGNKAIKDEDMYPVLADIGWPLAKSFNHSHWIVSNRSWSDSTSARDGMLSRWTVVSYHWTATGFAFPS